VPGRFGRHAFDGGHQHVWGLLFLIGFAALVAVVVYLIVRRGRPVAMPVGSSAMRPVGIDPAVEAARMRYAQGQLSREAYAQIVADLTGQAPAAPPPPPTPEV
jgi:uncharacterized membrane protein